MASAGARVAVTGLGAIAAIGHDVSSLWAACVAGRCGIRPIANIPTERLSVRVAAEIAGFDPLAHLDKREVQLMDRAAQLAVVAAREAVAQAGLPPLAEPHRAGVILGAAIGHDTLDLAFRQLYGEGASRVHPLTVPRGMPSASASHVSMAFGCRGPSFATASACASATHAIGQAFHMVRSGMLDVAITGGSDASLSVGVIKSWEGLRVLSPDVCRPFSRDRQGLVLGEGAAILVLEPWERAEARGAAILAEIVGFGMSADAADLTAPDATGAAWAMVAALDDAGLAPADIGYVNAHGTGTRLNDRAEAAALAHVFGPRAAQPPVSSSKAQIGHCLGAGGAIELVLTIEALRHGVIPPTIGFREPDPDCDIDCVPNAARPAAIAAALSNSFAFGGLNAVLAVRRAP